MLFRSIFNMTKVESFKLEQEPEENLLLAEEDFEKIQSSPDNILKKEIHDNLKSTGMETPVIKNNKIQTQYLFEKEAPSAVAWETWASHALAVYENPPGVDDKNKEENRINAAKTFIDLVELLIKRADAGELDEELTGVAFELGEYMEVVPELDSYIKWRASLGEDSDNSSKQTKTESTDKTVANSPENEDDSVDEMSIGTVLKIKGVGLGLAAGKALREMGKSESDYIKEEQGEKTKGKASIRNAEALKILADWGVSMVEGKDANDKSYKKVNGLAYGLVELYPKTLSAMNIMRVFEEFHKAAYRRTRDTGDERFENAMRGVSIKLRQEIKRVDDIKRVKKERREREDAKSSSSKDNGKEVAA